MIPYITQHAAPMTSIMAGIVADIPRYISDQATITTKRHSFGKGKTPAARAIQAKMLDIIKSGQKVSSRQLVTEMNSNRFTIYQNAAQMVEDGVIRLVKIGSRMFYWEVV